MNELGRFSFLVAMTLGAVGGRPLFGQDLSEQKVNVHGFGGWSLGRTSANRYLSGAPKEEDGHTTFSLNVSAELGPKLTVVSQVFWRSGMGEHESSLDMAFSEWKCSDRAKLRVARAPHPFGLYSQVFDVGTVRPSPELPQSVYGPVGFFAVSYSGFGLVGFRAHKSGWSMR